MHAGPDTSQNPIGQRQPGYSYDIDWMLNPSFITSAT